MIHETRWDDLRWDQVRRDDCWCLFDLPDINECLLGASNCRGGERCINTEGSFRCQREVSCGTGYELTDNNNCKGEWKPQWSHLLINAWSSLHSHSRAVWPLTPSDIDECETEIHNCGSDFQCQNTQGSFRCLPKVRCGAGYIQDALGNCIGEQKQAVNSHRLYMCILSDWMLGPISTFNKGKNQTPWPELFTQTHKIHTHTYLSFIKPSPRRNLTFFLTWVFSWKLLNVITS